MKDFLDELKKNIEKDPPKFGDGTSALALLYEAYNEVNPVDNDQIKENFNALYQAMNGMKLQEMDRILYPVCALCRDHERAGFTEGVKIGIRLSFEIGFQ